MTAQERARHHLAARQARRLPGARSGQIRTVHRRGRFRRRLRQAGPQPRIPGGAAAARQNPQCRTRAHGQDAVVRADRHADHRARHRHRHRRIRHRQAALSQDHHHDRRRRRRRPYPHAAADVLLPADARDHRPRLSLHRPAAALQSRPRQVRAISQGRARARGLPDRYRPRRDDLAPVLGRSDAPATICASWSRTRARSAICCAVCTAATIARSSNRPRS